MDARDHGHSLSWAGQIPVLFNEDAQGLWVGEDNISVQAEVKVALGVLSAVVPEEDKSKAR